MSILSSREFNQDTGGAKKKALEGPVYITDRGKPSFVLLSYNEYRAMASKKISIGEMLSMDGVEDIEFTIGELPDIAKAAEF